MSDLDPVSYFELGASLYMPLTYPNVSTVLQQGLPDVRSMIFCCEDAVLEYELPLALDNLRRALRQLQPDRTIRRFVRPRNAAVLAEILAMPGVQHLDGFVLPKADLNTLLEYKKVLSRSSVAFAIMPTLETIQVLDAVALPRIRTLLDQFGQRILCLRIGGNDLLNLMGLKRLPNLTAYDTPLRMVLDQLVLAFRPFGYNLSAPVFDFIDDEKTLISEVARDISYGFYAKTAIHPKQISIIESQYALYLEFHRKQAEALLSKDAKAVFLMDGEMMEKSCHSSWALRTLQLMKGRSESISANVSLHVGGKQHKGTTIFHFDG